MTSELRPRIRPEIEFYVGGGDDDPRVHVHDPEGYATQIDHLSRGALAVLRYFDGEHTLAEIQAALVGPDGTLLPLEQLEEFARHLDETALIEGAGLDRAREQRAAWLAAPVRPAEHAGTAYPAEPAEAAAFLDTHLAHAHAPAPATGPLARLIAPHIDLRLGSEVHGHAHARLRAAGRPDVVVVIGVCHQPATAPFIACRKDFATPQGVVRHDATLLDAIEERFGASLDEGVIAHEAEHSVEFQALWLAHHWPVDPPAIVPLLARGFHEQIDRQGSPSDDPAVERFIEALRASLAADPRRVVVVASVDLAHVGPLYETEGLDEEGERALAAADRVLLDAIEANDAEAFFAAIAQNGNASQVCGVAPIYLALRLGDGPGELLRYGQGRIHPESGSVVSYTAVGFAR